MSIAIRVVDEFDDERFKELVKRNLEDATGFIPAWEYFTDGDQSFSSEGEKIRIGAFEQETLIGLSWGQATKSHRFMMHMSLVEAEYRGQGVYRAMLELMLEKTRKYDSVDSWHHILNNRVIATKLRYGFNIVGFDQSIIIGPRINMRFFNNDKLYELMKFRTGLVKMPEFHCSEGDKNEC